LINLYAGTKIKIYPIPVTACKHHPGLTLSTDRKIQTILILHGVVSPTVDIPVADLSINKILEKLWT
jgi:hypothetical protein